MNARQMLMARFMLLACEMAPLTEESGCVQVVKTEYPFLLCSWCFSSRRWSPLGAAPELKGVVTVLTELLCLSRRRQSTRSVHWGSGVPRIKRASSVPRLFAPKTRSADPADHAAIPRSSRCRRNRVVSLLTFAEPYCKALVCNADLDRLVNSHS
jgi:hypothetical protein